MKTHEKTIAKQAAAYFARRRSASWSKADEETLRKWLREDPAHAVAWLEYEHLWAGLDSVKADPRVLGMRAEARGRGSPGALRGIRLTAVGLAATVLVGLALWLGMTHFRSGAVAGQIFTTGVGQRSEIVLADGSHVTLDTATTLRVVYSARSRRIFLERGQAYFEVAKNAAWPFVVAADGREVLATGTQFNVWRQPDELQVVLVEGRVRVSRGSAIRNPAGSSAPIDLTPGSMLTVRDGAAAHVDRVNAVDAVSWRSGRLVFQGARLGDAVAELNRYWRQRIVITDAALADRKITAVFATSASAAGIARTLQTYGLARMVKKSPTAIYLAPP